MDAGAQAARDGGGEGAGPGPLARLKVIDLTRVRSGPTAARQC
jgi:crotonobetainyl-CoA:carnitine CoA-transferase CaiB-like acyl-CoA transferase